MNVRKYDDYGNRTLEYNALEAAERTPGYYAQVAFGFSLVLVLSVGILALMISFTFALWRVNVFH